MLIKALSDYYDILASKGEITPEGFSKVKIHYKVALTEDGKIDEIIDFRKKDTIKTGKDKIKEIDDKAFIIVSHVEEVSGNGFTYSKEMREVLS